MRRRLLLLAFTTTLFALTLLGTYVTQVAVLFGLVLLTGSGIVGGQTALNALGATMYPTTARSTGVGWALGIGRFGAILAPLLGGALLTAGIAAERVFALAIAPTLFCAAVIVLLGIDARRRTVE